MCNEHINRLLGFFFLVNLCVISLICRTLAMEPKTVHFHLTVTSQGGLHSGDASQQLELKNTAVDQNGFLY